MRNCGLNPTSAELSEMAVMIEADTVNEEEFVALMVDFSQPEMGED